MATRNAAQSANRPSGSGSGTRSGNSGGMVDNVSSGDAQWLFYGMLFFAIVCFVTLPISVFVLMDSKKTNADAHAALAETKKLQAQLKPVKKEKDDE